MKVRHLAPAPEASFRGTGVTLSCELTFAAGKEFGYHGVAVEVSAELRFRDFDLRE